MKLNKDIEERPPRSQQYYNRVYLGLIAGLFLVVFVLFPKRGMEFKRYLSFNQQKGDVIYVKSSSRVPSIASRTESTETKKQYYAFPSIQGKYYDTKTF